MRTTRTGRLRRTYVALALAALGIGSLAGIALATPGSGLTTTIVSQGRFGPVNVRTHSGMQQVQITTRGDSDVYVVSNKLAPGGQTGWHTHAGPSLITRA